MSASCFVTEGYLIRQVCDPAIEIKPFIPPEIKQNSVQFDVETLEKMSAVDYHQTQVQAPRFADHEYSNIIQTAITMTGVVLSLAVIGFFILLAMKRGRK